MRVKKEMSLLLCDAEESPKIHYLNVLYLFHMPLLSNPSLQIPDSENKQMDQSCCFLWMHHSRHSCNAAWWSWVKVQVRVDGWMDGQETYKY